MLLDFLFRRNKQDDSIRLEYDETWGPSEESSWVKTICFDIVQKDVKVGECDLRVGMNEEIYYAGQIGYRIYLPYRGHGYAYEACKQLFGIAKDRFAMTDLYITCSPDNIPSNKTLEKLNGEFVGKVNVPNTHWLYRRGETVKNIYHYNL